MRPKTYYSVSRNATTASLKYELSWVCRKFCMHADRGRQFYFDHLTDRHKRKRCISLQHNNPHLMAHCYVIFKSVKLFTLHWSKIFFWSIVCLAGQHEMIHARYTMCLYHPSMCLQSRNFTLKRFSNSALVFNKKWMDFVMVILMDITERQNVDCLLQKRSKAGSPELMLCHMNV